MFKTTRRLTMAGAAALAAGITGRRASAQDATVKIGVIYPLSGNSATAGNYSKMALEVGADVVNNGNADLAKLIPLAKGGGLPGLKGAKIQLIFADNQGTPAAGQNQALRLITEEKVVALIGAYQSGITLTASAIAERHGIPFVNGESVAANLTERGFKWFFRVTPVALDFARALPGLPKPRVFARNIMTPQHARSLQQALEQNLGNYEKAFGTIPVVGEPNGRGKGEHLGFTGGA